MTEQKICAKHSMVKQYKERMVKGKLRREWVCKECANDNAKKRYEKKKQDKLTYKPQEPPKPFDAISYDKEYRERNKEKIVQRQKDYYETNKDTIKNRAKDYYYTHKEQVLEYQRTYYEENKEQINQYTKQYCEENKDELIRQQKERIDAMTKEERNEFNKRHSISNKKYRQNNREKINERKRNKKKNNIEYRLRELVSNAVYSDLKKQGKSKNRRSTTKHLNINEMREHIEAQFKLPGNEWMTWDKWGIYDPETWDDNNKSTWTFHIDHYPVPKCDLPYNDYDHPNFKKCWAAENLRPYPAKWNVIEGNRKNGRGRK
jgi:hypothetical protein